MKKQALLTLIAIIFFGMNMLQGQQVLSFASVKKNGIYIEPFAAIGSKKELRLGYERMLSRYSALNLGLGMGLNVGDPDLEEMSREWMDYSFTRTGSSELTWLLIIPVWSTTYSTPLPQEEAEQSTTRYLQSLYFASVEFKRFLTTNMKSKIPNGLYVAPGLLGGIRNHAVYDYSRGTRNELERYDEVSNTWGVPLLFGTQSGTWTERVTVYEFESRTRSQEVKKFLYPYLRAGYQLPVGSFISVDLSGQLLMGEEKEEPANPDGLEGFQFDFYNKSRFHTRLQASMVLRVSAWF